MPGWRARERSSRGATGRRSHPRRSSERSRRSAATSSPRSATSWRRWSRPRGAAASTWRRGGATSGAPTARCAAISRRRSRTSMSEQQAAVQAPGGAAVLAGAGCGKTTVLARRFVHLLRARDDGTALVGEVGRILAITFTEKAAAEMKKRIRALVAAELAAAPEGAPRAHWERVRRDLLGAQISTIHAF